LPHNPQRVDGNAGRYTGHYAGHYAGTNSETPQWAPAEAWTFSCVADMFRANAHPNYSSGNVLQSR
jgi:hypothetical protein